MADQGDLTPGAVDQLASSPLAVGELLGRYVAASLEHDYTVDADCSPGYDTDEAEHEAAVANIVEMHRLLNVRAERLMDAHEEISRLRASLPADEVEWGTRDRRGQVHSVGVENEAQARSMLSMTPVRRTVGPWEPVGEVHGG